MRRPNTRPTVIYWLIDVRPSILAKHPAGLPFYCGKTVETPRKRLAGHRAKAKLWPSRPSHHAIIECGEHIEFRIMEIIHPGEEWIKREKHWIAIIRYLYQATNVSAGGVGTPGQIPSTETRLKRSASMKGRIFSEESKAKMREAWKTRAPDSAETIKRKSESHKGLKCAPRSDKYRAKMSAAKKQKEPTV